MSVGSKEMLEGYDEEGNTAMSERHLVEEAPADWNLSEGLCSRMLLTKFVARLKSRLLHHFTAYNWMRSGLE